MILSECHLFLTRRQLILLLVDEQRLVREWLARNHARMLHARLHEHCIVEFVRHLGQVGRWHVFFHIVDELFDLGAREMILRLNLVDYSIFIF